MSETTAPEPAATPEPAAVPEPAAHAEVNADADASADAGQITPASSAPATAASAASTPATTAPAAKPAPVRTPEQRARRGAAIAGAIGLPLATAGIVMLAVPLAVWCLNTIIRTIAVVIANAVSGADAAEQTNDTLASIEPNAVSGFTLALAIVGAAFLIAGVLVSIFVMRANGVHRFGMVTAIALPVGLVVATILSATIGALGGLLFGTSDTVGQILANAAFGIALSAIGSVAVTVAAGALVWPVVARAFRDPVPASAAHTD